jgi:hypothetical protein
MDPTPFAPLHAIEEVRTMKRAGTPATLVAMGLLVAATAWAQPPRQDAIWARSTAGAPIVLDGVLNEPAWALAESKVIDWATDAGIPGSGYKPEGGFLPTDPTHATVKFLTVGNVLYMGIVLPDKSIGGSKNFNRFDGLLMSIKDHLSANHPAPPTEHFYVWWNNDPLATDPQPIGQQPAFAGGPFAANPSYSPRTPDQIDAWDAVTVVDGITNDDTHGDDVSWTVEMKFNLNATGYDITQPGGDIVEFNLSIYDCDNYWPLVPINLASNRVWWQGPWGNSNGYNEVRIHCRPDVTVNSATLPYLAPELIIPNGHLFPSPNIDGLLNDAVWAHAPSFDIRYGDDALRDSYPGILKWRGGQYQPEVNGGLAAILDPADCTVKYFFRDDSLFLGFDVRDAVVQSYPLTDRMDGFVVGLYDRTARESFDNTLQPHRLTFDVGPTGEARTADYLTTLVNNGGARVRLQLKPGTTLDTTGTDIDAGYTAELVVDLTKIGYPPGRGDGLAFLSVCYYDGDSFIPYTDSYGTRTWWAAEYDNTCCPPWGYMDPFENVLLDAPGPGTGVSAFRLRNAAPNPMHTATTLHYRLGAASHVRLEVFDAMGRVVHARDLGVMAAGEQHSALFGLQTATGVYPYRLRMTDPVTGAELATLAGRLLVVR